MTRPHACRVLIVLPQRDFDPSEAAVTWRILNDEGHRVDFATPDALPASADPLMLAGEGLDLWGRIPLLRKIVAHSSFVDGQVDTTFIERTWPS